MGASMLQGVVCCCVKHQCELCDPPKRSIIVTLTGLTWCHPCVEEDPYTFGGDDPNGEYTLPLTGWLDPNRCDWAASEDKTFSSIHYEDSEPICTTINSVVQFADRITLDVNLTREGEDPDYTYFWELAVGMVSPWPDSIPYWVFYDKVEVGENECTDIELTNQIVPDDCLLTPWGWTSPSGHGPYLVRTHSGTATIT